MMESGLRNYRLMEVVTMAREALDRLREHDGQIIETEDELRTALAEEGIGIDDVLRRLGRAALDAKTDGAAAEQRISDLRARRERLQRREETMRATLLLAMQALEMKSFKDVEFSASVSDGKAKVVVTDIDALPLHCVAHQVVKTPDKDAIREAIHDAAVNGRNVPGATLSNAAPVLTIRSK